MKYFYYLKLGFKLNIKYSRWFLLEISSVCLRFFLIYYFWKYIYENKVINRIDFNLNVIYALSVVILEKMVVNLSDSIAKNIKKGTIVIDLIKPYNIFLKYIFLDIGKKFSEITKYFTIYVVLLNILDIKIEISKDLFLVKFLIFILGIILSMQLEIIVGILAFWTVNIWGLKFLSGLLMLFASGALIPVNFYPIFLKKISFILPFELVMYSPVAVIIGIIKSKFEIKLIVFRQFFWIFLLLVIIILLWKKMKKRIVIFGG